jgi:hypothetical protein
MNVGALLLICTKKEQRLWFVIYIAKGSPGIVMDLMELNKN